MSRIIENRRYDAERALYNLTDAEVRSCTFAGPADGESALKEARDITVRDTAFSLRNPMWHVKGFRLENSTMDESARAALWYGERGEITGTTLGGIKAVRECHDITLRNCTIRSQEFGWKCGGIRLEDSGIESEYVFLDSRDVTLERVRMKGKYSFQYMENLTITDCDLDTKDAFWHSRNVTVVNSTVRGEYLGWFSENLTLINCRIIGTQPLCYCTGLKLRGCTMEGTDLAFEYSDVEADIRGHVDSIKNPKSGMIIADSVGEIIRENPVMECDGYVQIRGEGWNWSC